MDDAAKLYWSDAPVAPGYELDDIDAFVDRMELTGETRRKLRAPGVRGAPRQNKSDDAVCAVPKIDLVLYMSTASDKSQKALRAIREVLAQYVASQVKFSLCDLSQRPEDGEVDAVLFTPTLVKQGPGPRTSIIGNLEQEEILKDLLDASGVERRRWDD